MSIPHYIFLFLVFPGLLFSGAMGLILGWVDRKVTARLQWRVGPPWYQNFIDVMKLAFFKETLIPRGVPRGIFLGMPAAALAASTLVSTMLCVINANPAAGFIGDVIVVVYLLLIPPIALMLGSFASANPLASIGGSREMKLMLSYELPLILALAVPVMKSAFSIRLGDIISSQFVHGIFIASPSGALSFIVMLLCVQAKLGFIPFDMPEAETELMAGTCIEYSGKPLAMFKLTKAITGFAVPILLITLYFGGIKLNASGALKTAAEYLFILVLMMLIKNTNPRLRIDQAMSFFWSAAMAMSAAAVALAYFGW
jgi:NADH-quinone oxidoreductase subunit H